MFKPGFPKLMAAILSCAVFYSCSKSAEDFSPKGGGLPTNYVVISDSTFTPSMLTIATGSSVTFVNDTENEHSIVSDDSVTIVSNAIAPHQSFFFKKDTVAVIGYHCGVHNDKSGVIILRP